MQWHDIQEHYSDRWLIIEALEAHSADDKRILDDLAVLDSYSDSTSAMRRCRELHREAPGRELYVFYASRPHLTVTGRAWLGARSQ